MFKSLFVIALPIILQNLMQSTVNMLDTLMVGQLGSMEIAAVGLGNQIYMLLNMVLFGISSGGAIFIAQFWGKKENSGIWKMEGVMFSFSIVIALIFTFASVFFPKFLIGLYSKDFHVIEIGARYLRIVAFSFPFFAMSFAFSMALRSTEHVKLPMVATMISLVLNAILNYLLIFGIGFFPSLGIVGAAIATCISRIVECFILFIVAYSKKYEVASSVKNLFSFTLFEVRKFIKIAFPVIINEAIWGLGTSMHSLIMGRTSTEAISAFNITGTISQITWVFFIGVGNAAGIIIGKKIGEGNETEARKYANTLSWFMPVMAIFIGLLLIPISKFLPFMFNVEANILVQAKMMLMILMCCYPLNAFNMCWVVGICRAGGDTVFAAIIDVCFMWIIAIPLAACVAYFTNVQPYIIYICLLSEQIFKAIVGFYRIKSGKWLHNVVE
ncbi:MAG: MATE family efflux transporter [Spirochaetaceae bacterium]|nr:MATE family efflux transporter [Spirochaetaceae bacterium]